MQKINELLHEWELFLVIILTLFAKWLMTEQPIPEDEDTIQKVLRRRRAYGGVLAGALTAYYGPQILILWFDFFTNEQIIPMTIVAALSGEHLFRAIITKLPVWIDLYIQRGVKR